MALSILNKVLYKYFLDYSDIQLLISITFLFFIKSLKNNEHLIRSVVATSCVF